MNSRTTWTLMLLAAAVFAFIMLVERRVPLPGDQPAPPKLLPQLEVETVDCVQVRPADQPEIRADRTNRLWTLTKPTAYPAEPEAIRALLQALANLNSRTRLTAQDLKSHSDPEKEFGIDPPQYSLIVHQGGSAIQIRVGNLTPFKDQVYLQVVGRDGFFIVDANLLRLIPQKKDDWRSTALVDLTDLALDRIAITNSGKLLMEFQRTEPARLWRMTVPLKARADNPKLDTLLQNLQSLRATRFVSKDSQADLSLAGLQPPELELALAQGTNTRVRLQFGKSPTNDASQVFARRPDWGSVVLVPAEAAAPWRGAYNDFRDRHLAAFTPNLLDEIETRSGTNLLFRLRPRTNGVWQVTETAGTNGFAADSALVDDLLGALATLEVAEFKKDVVPDSGWPEYGLASPTLRFILHTSATNVPDVGTNGVLVELQFGSETNDLVHARRADEQCVYLVKRRDVERLPAAAWQLRDRLLWSFTEDDVARVTLRQQGATTEFVRRGANSWTVPTNSTINDLALDEAVHRLGDRLTATKWVARGAESLAPLGFAADSAQIAVELKSGETRIVQFGGVRAQMPLAATPLDGEPWVFGFSWYVYRFLQTSLGLALPQR